MAGFGKLNFSVAFNPTSAFMLDARCYFEGENALSNAQVAAEKAEEVGSTNTVYHYGQKLLVNENGVYTWYKITTDHTLEAEGSGGGTSFETDETLSLDNGILSVKTASSVEEDNTLPITSAAVHTIVGNIEILLRTI